MVQKSKPYKIMYPENFHSYLCHQLSHSSMPLIGNHFYQFVVDPLNMPLCRYKQMQIHILIFPFITQEIAYYKYYNASISFFP